MGDGDVAGPVAQERGGTRAQAELEHEVVGRAAVHPEQPRMQATLVVEGAERDAIVRRIGAAGGAEPEVMIVQVSPRRAAGDRAAIAVALDDRVETARTPVAQRPCQERTVEQTVEHLAVGEAAAPLGPQPRPEGLSHRRKERSHVVRHAPRG